MMRIHAYAAVYAASLLIFLLMDLIWLGWLARPYYHRQLGALLSNRVNWSAALLFYLIYVIGLMIFSIAPAAASKSLASAALLGGLYGFFTYATYELTSYALIRGWPPALVPVDIAWGVALCTVTASCGYAVARWLHA